MMQKKRRPRNHGKKIIAAEARVDGMSQFAAADKAGIGRATLQRWEQIPGDPDYWAAWEDARKALKKGITSEATAVLRLAMRADRPSDRIRAAEILLRNAEGDAPQGVKHLGPDEGPVKVEYSMRAVTEKMKQMARDGEFDDSEE
jgi:hypothetical protein